MFTVQQIVSATGAPYANVESVWPTVVEAMKWQGIYDHYTQIAMIATIAVETGVTVNGVNLTFLPIRELGGQNASYAPYFGRGLIQCTWESNYAYYGPLLSPPQNLVAYPDTLLQVKPSAQMAALYFKNRNIQAHANSRNWVQCRVDVNGGTNGLGPFMQSVTALLSMEEAPDVPPVTTVSVSGALKQAPSHTSNAALGPNKKKVVLKVGQRVRFTSDPHMPGHPIISEDKLWAHIDVDRTPEHGWYLRENLVTK